MRNFLRGNKGFMKKILLVLISIGAFISAPAAEATTAGYGYIGQIIAGYNGAILFNTDGARSGTLPSCQGAGLGQRWAIDASTTAGQAAVSVLLNAYNQHKRIYVDGRGVCTIWGDTETVNFISMQD